MFSTGIVMGIILLGALMVSAAPAAASEWLPFWMPGVMMTQRVANAIISFPT